MREKKKKKEKSLLNVLASMGNCDKIIINVSSFVIKNQLILCGEILATAEL